MSVEIRDPRFAAVVGEAVAFEPIGTGFLFTEGPLWHPAEHYLLFSDMPGDHIRRWHATGGVTTFRKPSNMSNGLAWDRQGRLLACEHATSRVSRTESDGSISVIASHYQGKELNSPNDIVVKSDGGIYFSDPTYGRMKYYGRERACELSFQGVYRADASGLVLLADDFAQPNGLCFSHDEARLFVNDTSRQHIRVFDVRADGTLAGGQVWAQTTGTGPGAPDGMKLDSAGNLYCCGPGGIHVFAPDATALGVIRTPEPAANFCFGDADRRSLYITASTSVYRIRVAVAG
ncbi:SMP-30/gluconolactonase/LRE family protein [Vineibacter terrae]|uniref:SMP-30/gluconolactonase/LRE family protein n=1 Tax=Vineibacter terrae TaxID=2586908 RepID=A0A5C8PC27_9HYPH|nr:SMP-30/gluconolactonase/LRE family protein [Vineibacter terrae]TXL71259.1 SMP-30/gluconolactonase/LRE family protein [Vineibacter terrae]